MKKILLSTISLIVFTGVASAATNEELLQEIKALKAENAALRAKSQTHSSKITRNSNSAFQTANLPVIKSEPVAAPIPLWQGFYAGLNAGYGWGTNSNTTSSLWSAGRGGFEILDYDLQAPFTGAGVGATRQATSQSGYIGGAQFGYNYQYAQSILFGFETDIQGTGMRGGSNASGVYAGSGSQAADPRLPGLSTTINQTGYGMTAVSAGLDYLGTARVRVGYLFTPNILIYGTGGFAYGGAWANVSDAGVSTISSDVINSSSGASTIGCPTFCPAVAQPWNGGGRGNALLVGYSAGGGVEWMFMPNWSLKGEAIYYNLGNMNIATTAIAAPAYSKPNGLGNVFVNSGVIGGNTSVNYQGVIARLGVNYHVNFGATPVVAKF
jgi:outer membrane immunogenic protein